MRKERHPTHYDWYVAIESALASALQNTGITGYRLNGASTQKKPRIKDEVENSYASMPYAQALLRAVVPGWDDSQSGQSQWEDYDYEDIGGTKYLKQTVEIRERLEFEIVMYTNEYDHLLKMSQAIRSYFGVLNTVTITWKSADYSVNSHLSDFAAEEVEENRSGKIRYYRASWSLTLMIKTDMSADDVVVKEITDVVADVEATVDADGTNTNTISKSI